MTKLKKKDFDRTFRFRRSREKSLVNCVSCANISGEQGYDQRNFCNHPERTRKIGLWENYLNILNKALKRVCDAYTPKPLPEGVMIPFLPEKNVILLGSQWGEIMHADPNCPYVIEELRKVEERKKDEEKGVFNKHKIELKDRSDLVPKETIGRQICEMPCCDSKLPYQAWRIDDYRRAVGIKPDGSEPRIWVKNGIKSHERKVEMTPEEAEAVFDLSRFNSPEFGEIHSRILAVSNHLCEPLGHKCPSFIGLVQQPK